VFIHIAMIQAKSGLMQLGDKNVFFSSEHTRTTVDFVQTTDLNTHVRI